MYILAITYCSQDSGFAISVRFVCLFFCIKKRKSQIYSLFRAPVSLQLWSSPSLLASATVTTLDTIGHFYGSFNLFLLLVCLSVSYFNYFFFSFLTVHALLNFVTSHHLKAVTKHEHTLNMHETHEISGKECLKLEELTSPWLAGDKGNTSNTRTQVPALVSLKKKVTEN